MRLMEILTSPWMIMPDKYHEIKAVYETHLRGEKIDLKKLEARTGMSLQNNEQGYDVVQGVAIIPVEGVIARKMNLFTQISGGVSTELLTRDFKEAMNDPGVNSIILSIDSPGGEVSGIFELANMIYEARGEKKVVAYADNTMASAAYLIGAAAEEVLISGKTNIVGSIGVVATHQDKSKAESEAGIKTTEIYAGKYKRIASQHEPLSEEGRADIQGKVDYIYSLFVDHVATYRGAATDTVIANMADGRSFIGKQAIDVGLADGVSTIEDLIASLSGIDPDEFVTTLSGDDSDKPVIKTEKMEVTGMDLTKLKADHPELYAEVVAQAREGFVAEDTIDGIKAEAAKAETERIQGVFSHHRPGREKLVGELMFDGVTTADAAAGRILAAEDKTRANVAADIAADAPEPLPAAEPGTDLTVDANLPIEERCKATWEKSPDLRTEFSGFEAYLAFEKAQANGSAKILKK